jgi:spore coat protein U-like protein
MPAPPSPARCSFRALLLAIAVLGLYAVPAAAQGCSVSTSGAIRFGTYDVFATGALDTTGTVSYICDNKDHDIQITLSRGRSATYRPRVMTNGADQIAYNLYSDAAFTVVWGDLSEGTGVYTRHNPPNGRWIDLTVFARIPARQDVSVGTYTDSLVVEINF